MSWMEKVEDGLEAQEETREQSLQGGSSLLSLQVASLPYTLEMLITETGQRVFGSGLER